MGLADWIRSRLPAPLYVRYLRNCCFGGVEDDACVDCEFYRGPCYIEVPRLRKAALAHAPTGEKEEG